MTSDIITCQTVLCDLRLYNLEIKGSFYCNLTAFVRQRNFSEYFEDFVKYLMLRQFF
jgi:hypothetical protein